MAKWSQSLYKMNTTLAYLKCKGSALHSFPVIWWFNLNELRAITVSSSSHDTHFYFKIFCASWGLPDSKWWTAVQELLKGMWGEGRGHQPLENNKIKCVLNLQETWAYKLRETYIGLAGQPSSHWPWQDWRSWGFIACMKCFWTISPMCQAQASFPLISAGMSSLPTCCLFFLQSKPI